MDAALKAKWVEALRSGGYQQAKLSLRGEAGFCCLGVLCDVMGARWKADREAVVNGRPQAGYLDDVIANSINLPEASQIRLYSMNDSGSSFTEIADYIEANIPAD